MRMPGNQTFNTFWHGERISTIEQVCMESFVKHNHVLRVYTYSDARMPTGVIVDDAAKIMRLERFFTFEGRSSAFSNIFRCKSLLEHGAWWMDSGILCVQRGLPH